MSLKPFSQHVEPLLIICATLLVVVGSSRLPVAVMSSTLCCVVAALLLGQGLVRDLAMLVVSAPDPGEKVFARAICIESGLGVVLLLAGVVLSLLAITVSVKLTPLMWVLLVALVLTVGYLLRNTVLDMKHWRFYQASSHRNVVFRWR